MSEKLALDALFRRAGAPRRPTVVLTRKPPPNLPSNMAPSLRRVQDQRGQLYRNREPNQDEARFLSAPNVGYEELGAELRARLAKDGAQHADHDWLTLKELQAELDDEAQFLAENRHYEPHLKKLVDAKPPRPAGDGMVYCRRCGDKVRIGQMHYAGNNPENGPGHRP